MSSSITTSPKFAVSTPCCRPPCRALPAAANCNWLLVCIYVVLTYASVVFAATLAMAEEAPCDSFSFTRPPFVSPRIIQDLEPWISDRGEQVVAINLPGSVGSNRYSGEVTTLQPDKTLPPTVVYKDKDACQDQSCPSGAPSFTYQSIGRTPAGVYVLRTTAAGGGSGTFMNLLLVTLQSDRGFSYDKDRRSLSAGRQRCLIKRMEAIPLGDRYSGEVFLDGNVLHVGADGNPRGARLFEEDVEMIVPAPPDE